MDEVFQIFEEMERRGVTRWEIIADPRSGLRAVLVIDDHTLGPAAGGIRTKRYPTLRAAAEDAAALARAMTLKCALSGLEAGGAKCVVLDHPGLDRPRAFRALGERVEALRGLYRTGADLGTSAEDMKAVGEKTRYSHAPTEALIGAVGRSMLRCIQGAADFAGLTEGGNVAGLRVAIQGCGAIGQATARSLAEAGASLLVADLDEEKARAVARMCGAQVLAPDEILAAEVDVLAPCATGGVVTGEVAERMRARVLCGGANNVLAGEGVAELLRARDIVHVPDVLASGGAVIEGIGETVMKLTDRSPLIDALTHTTRQILAEAARIGQTPEAVALEVASHRIAARKR